VGAFPSASVDVEADVAGDSEDEPVTVVAGLVVEMEFSVELPLPSSQGNTFFLKK